MSEVKIIMYNAIYSAIETVSFIIIIYFLYRLILWAKKRSKGAFLFAMFLPMIAVQPTPPPSYECIEEAKKTKKENDDDSGDPPNGYGSRKIGE